MQRVPTVVPKGIRAGQAFEVKVDGHSHKAMCPAYAHEGDTILVDVPITPAREAGASVDGDDTHKPANQAQDRSLTEASSANAEDAETKQAVRFPGGFLELHCSHFFRGCLYDPSVLNNNSCRMNQPREAQHLNRLSLSSNFSSEQ